MSIVIGGLDDCHDGPMLRRLLHPFVLQNAQGHRAPLLWHNTSQPLLRLGVERLNAFGIGDVDRAAAVQHKAVVVGQELVPVLFAAALAACSRLS